MRNLFFIAGLLVVLFCNGQSIFLPYNIQQAYNNKTRNNKGVPGVNYFQNNANYAIKADFDPKTGSLDGRERIVYFNNSPDSLHYFVIRLYHDILKKGNLRDEEIPSEYLTNGVELSSFKINDEEYINKEMYYFKRRGTNLYAGINYYALPGDSIIFDIEWKTVIPAGHIHRFGKYGDGNWFIAYWYPQIAVYDDIDGWDKHNYTGRYEFYNDINNFDVEIKLPSGYLTWATGNWLNANEILKPQIHERYQQVQESDSQLTIVNRTNWEKNEVLVKKKKLTYKYRAEKVPDFAFAVSNNYEWKAASTCVDSASKKRTVVHSVFPSTANEFRDIAQTGAKSVNHFSHNSLKVPYPYNNATIFCGSGGMEFPMMVNMRNKSISENVFTSMHELFHAYFPFYTGCNERKYAWLDEGLTSYLPIETEASINKEMDFPLSKFIDIYNRFSGEDQESPLFTPSLQTRDHNYYHQAYYRSTTAFSILEEYMGYDNFRSAVLTFIDTWKYKHPTGYDFIFSINNATDEDLAWLIEPWFFGSRWADLSIDSVKQTDSGYDIIIKNIGGLPVPVVLKIIPTKSDSYFIRRKADAWKNSKRLKIHVDSTEELKRLELGDLNIPDKTSDNNYYFFKALTSE